MENLLCTIDLVLNIVALIGLIGIIGFSIKKVTRKFAKKVSKETGIAYPIFTGLWSILVIVLLVLNILRIC